MLRAKRVVSLLSLVLALAVVPGLASAGSGFSATVVSGPSPFGDCNVGASPGVSAYTNAEVEP